MDTNTLLTLFVLLTLAAAGRPELQEAGAALTADDDDDDDEGNEIRH